MYRNKKPVKKPSQNQAKPFAQYISSVRVTSKKSMCQWPGNQPHYLDQQPPLKHQQQSFSHVTDPPCQKTMTTMDENRKNASDFNST